MATEAQITIRFGYTNKRYFILKHFQVYKYNNILRLFFDKQITIFIFLQIFEKSILQFECWKDFATSRWRRRRRRPRWGRNSSNFKVKMRPRLNPLRRFSFSFEAAKRWKIRNWFLTKSNLFSAKNWSHKKEVFRGVGTI